MRKIDHILYKTRVRIFLLVLLLFPMGRANAEELQYPTYFRTTTVLNMRSGPGTQYKILNRLDKGDTILIRFTEERGKGVWGMTYYNQESAYVSMRYVEYLEPYETPAPEKKSWWKNTWDWMCWLAGGGCGRC